MKQSDKYKAHLARQVESNKKWRAKKKKNKDAIPPDEKNWIFEKLHETPIASTDYANKQTIARLRKEYKKLANKSNT